MYLRSTLARTLSERHLRTEEAGISPSKEDTYLLVVKNNVITYLNGNSMPPCRLFRGARAARTSVRSTSLNLIRPSESMSSKSSELSEVSISAVCGSEELNDPDAGSVSSTATSPIPQKTNLDVFLTTDLKSISALSGMRVLKKPRDQPVPHDCRVSGCARLRINVSGQHYETRIGVLDRHPSTLLGNRVRRYAYYDRGRRELFFDRHRPSFEAIFDYYQHGGRLRRPYHVPSDVFLEEILFYELEDEAVEEYKRSEGHVVEDSPMPNNYVLMRIWQLFEYPETSKAAFMVAILSVIMTLVSIILFCVETLPTFSKSHCVGDETPNFLDPFFVIETSCTVWFTIEAIARFIACPSKLDFWKDFKNIVDVTAVIPYYVTFFNVLSTMSCASAKSSASLSFLRVIRLVRVFKLTKHSVGLQVLLLTFKASLEGLGMFLVALFVSLLVFSSAIYYAELGNKESQMESIPDAFWWAIITMTTVGYGDKVPKGVTGRLIGAACAITGVLTLAIPVPIITGHFNRFYSHKTGRGRHI